MGQHFVLFLRQSEYDGGIKIRTEYRVWMAILSTGPDLTFNRCIYLLNSHFFLLTIHSSVNNLLTAYQAGFWKSRRIYPRKIYPLAGGMRGNHKRWFLQSSARHTYKRKQTGSGRESHDRVHRGADTEETSTRQRQRQAERGEGISVQGAHLSGRHWSRRFLLAAIEAALEEAVRK